MKRHDTIMVFIDLKIQSDNDVDPYISLAVKLYFYRILPTVNKSRKYL